MAGAKRNRAQRTPPEIRREQLLRTALPIFAEVGYSSATLQAIGEGAGVTPNLINHYFPDGKRELYVETVRLACTELASLMGVDPEQPLEKKMPANIAVYVDEVLKPSPIYALYAHARQSADDDIRTLAMRARDAIVESIALNNLGTRKPAARVRRALVGYVAFAEATCEYSREQRNTDRAALERLLRDVLQSVVVAARA